MIRLLLVFVHADMRNGHEGLRALAKKEGVNLGKLEQGEYVLFINSERNRLKLFASNNIFAYLKLDRGKIEMRTLALIPKAFGARGRIEYDEVLKEVLLQELKK